MWWDPRMGLPSMFKRFVHEWRTFIVPAMNWIRHCHMHQTWDIQHGVQLKSIGMFFKYSPKRQQEFKQPLLVPVMGKKVSMKVNVTLTGIWLPQRMTVILRTMNMKMARKRVVTWRTQISLNQIVPRWRQPNLRLSRCVTQHRWNNTPHSKTLKINSINPYCHVWKVFPWTKAERNGMHNPRSRHRDFSIRSRALCSLLHFTLPNIFLDTP